ncbi:tRNA preQ1(34) S-adenosylmethionine ribosyltransferase-isomerase QueA [Hyphococcus sp.]|jgi:S-adenosylmethionine:tRNA ribosyltransferase-isomerase|uniref:tRNA preQ1(34) S-adenosylmethionine ribosyltransferase-isomerase QueA n=1 Tax=Hyphococcus sp. TaxID=2038636 RepID=UPI003D0B131A
MRVDLFDFDLPPERIALEPARPRDSARLLHVKLSGVDDRIIRDLPSLLRPGDLLVANDTKVIPAQLFGERPGRNGGEPVSIEATLHKDLGGDRWRAFVRPAKRIRMSDVIRFGEALSAEVVARDGAEAELQFDTHGENFFAALDKAGVMPLPPYIARKRPAGEEDKASYQTMFAEEEGSVAAPTAGLHFTPDLVAALKENGVNQMTITLHVGAGTFLPVTAEDTADHKMHSEWGEITEEQAEAINKTRAEGGRIIAVGTTSLRLLESAATEAGTVNPFAAETDIFITPGYRFKAVDMLMTNFHLPRSTLFMLVCAFAGTDAMKAAYAHAIENTYRFYSYGDACLLERAS